MPFPPLPAARDHPNQPMSASPTRHLNLSGASNFRDLGGYPTSDGRTVRWRQIFRSNHLGHLTDDDVAVLRELGVRSAFDFRGTEERTAALCGMPEITVHSLPVEPTVVAALRAIAAAGTPLSTDHAVEVMRDSYSGYVQNNTQHFRTLFAHLLEDRAPLVIHCTAGKDRTGFACALILHTLGVSEDIISEDYLLTNRFYRRDPNPAATCPTRSNRCSARCRHRFLPPRSRPSMPTTAISKPISAMASVSAKPNAPISKRATCRTELASLI